MADTDDFVREGKADRPIGFPPNPIIRQALEKLYVSIMGALDMGDFETFLKESSDLTYDEAKDKMLREYGSPKQLSEAKLKAKTAEAEAKLEQAEREARAEQRTLEQEFAEIEEVAHRTLAENLDLFRRNVELEKEVKRLKEELVKAKAAPPAPGMPAPAPPVPVAPPAHGSMYLEYKRRVSEVVTILEINELANEIFEIAEREEYSTLTKSDIAELSADLRRIGERRAMRLAEMKIPEVKPKRRPKERPEEVRIRVEAPGFMGVLPPQVMHRYIHPDIETVSFDDTVFIRDHELERTIVRNNLLLFPPQWYALPPEEKIRRYGWDIATAMKHAVEYLHKFSWEDLIKDYGIPEKYVDAWRKAAS